MYRKILVENEIQSGQRLLDQLDLAKIPVTAAFWMYSEDADEWRMMIVTPLVDTQGAGHLYGLIAVILRNPAGPPIPIPLERIYLLDPYDTRYRELRSAVGGGNGVLVTVAPSRNISTEDAYVYKVA